MGKHKYWGPKSIFVYLLDFGIPESYINVPYSYIVFPAIVRPLALWI